MGDFVTQVLRIHRLQPDQEDTAELVKRHLRSFVSRFGHAELKPRDVDDEIVAQALAIAPADTLIESLIDLRSDGRTIKPFRSYGWFISTFFERIHAISPKAIRKAREALHIKRKPMREAQEIVLDDRETLDPDFTRRCIEQLCSAAKGMR